MLGAIQGGQADLKDPAGWVSAPGILEPENKTLFVLGNCDATNFILPLNSKFECEFKISENPRRKEYLSLFFKLVKSEYQ